jgi:hypothetical protein
MCIGDIASNKGEGLPVVCVTDSEGAQHNLVNLDALLPARAGRRLGDIVTKRMNGPSK